MADSKNYSPETRVVVDHPSRVYMPPEYKNVKFVNFQKDTVSQLRYLVKTFKPRFVYYNAGCGKNTMLPGIAAILPRTKTRLVARFDQHGKAYKRWPDSEFLIYEISY